MKIIAFFLRSSNSAVATFAFELYIMQVQSFQGQLIRGNGDYLVKLKTKL